MTINQKIADYEAEILKLGTSNVHNLEVAKDISALYGAKTALESIFKGSGKIPNETTETAVKSTTESVRDEYSDILPELKKYMSVKGSFREKKSTQNEVNHCLERLVVEINEFLTVLKSNAKTEEELQIVKKIRTP